MALSRSEERALLGGRTNRLALVHLGPKTFIHVAAWSVLSGPSCGQHSTLSAAICTLRDPNRPDWTKVCVCVSRCGPMASMLHIHAQRFFHCGRAWQERLRHRSDLERGGCCSGGCAARLSASGPGNWKWTRCLLQVRHRCWQANQKESLSHFMQFDAFREKAQK